jgi:hypothetical protein
MQIENLSKVKFIYFLAPVRVKKRVRVKNPTCDVIARVKLFKRTMDKNGPVLQTTK